MFVLRRLQPGETDFERLWLAILGGAAVFGGGWLLAGLPTPACLFHAVTGWPCLTCGGTRCLRHLLAGNAATAFAWNPLVALGAVAAAVFLAYAAIVTAARLPRVRLKPLDPRKKVVLRVAVALAVAANWIYLVHRFSSGA